jgi:predicted ATP-dependent endonuclease of OLD family
MLRLIRCQFEGLRGFEELELSDLNAVTVFVGPNGAGKSTILRVLALSFSILNKGTLCDLMEKHDAWERFKIGRLYFEPTEFMPLKQYAEYFGGPLNEITKVEVEIAIEDGKFSVRRLRCNEHEIRFAIQQSTRADILQKRIAIKALENKRADLEKKRTPQLNHQQIQQLIAQASAVEAELDRGNRELDGLNAVTVKVTSAEDVGLLNRDHVDEFLSDLNFPLVRHVDTHYLQEDAIPKLISELLKDKKGKKASHAKYLESIGRLSRLLQAEVDVFEVENKADLHINGTSYERASSGTKISLSFFGLTNLGDPRCIILWDEPENGLHPTRRSRLLELMFGDGRQFVLATHAAEFAPVFSDQGKVFRSSSYYSEEGTDVRLSVQHVADRRGAFASLEALGVHPAKTLFTANVVIWVEGPTELLFYRHWLMPRMLRRGLYEGFHYAFMQYGGSLISYLSVADEGQLGSTFDLLSMCRHPIVIVDSDLRADTSHQSPMDFLKRGAVRLLNEIEKLNAQRPGGAKFLWTAGREIENYLPESAIWHAIASLWKGYEGHKESLQSRPLVIGKYDSYSEALKNHFIEAGVVDNKETDQATALAKGRSIWGSENKVEMMRSALTMRGLTEADLKYDFDDVLSEIENFVVQVGER